MQTQAMTIIYAHNYARYEAEECFDLHEGVAFSNPTLTTNCIIIALDDIAMVNRLDKANKLTITKQGNSLKRRF